MGASGLGLGGVGVHAITRTPGNIERCLDIAVLPGPIEKDSSAVDIHALFASYRYCY